MNSSAKKSFLAEPQSNEIFSIVVPTWNNLAYLKLCIRSIRQNSDLKHQIIVVVNEGTDGTNEWVKQQSDLSFILSDTNIGICIALNQARALVRTNYLLYLNDDMYVLPRWDTSLLEEIQKAPNKDFILSGTLIEPYDSGNSCVIVADFGKSLEQFKEDALLSQFTQLSMSDWMGSTWPPTVVHIDKWDEVGGYSEEFSPGMYSDPDFSMKLWQSGVRHFKGVAESRIYHFGKKSTGRVKQNLGKKTFLKKWKMSPSSFNKYYLKRGSGFETSKYEPEVPLTTRIKDYFKLNFG